MSATSDSSSEFTQAIWFETRGDVAIRLCRLEEIEQERHLKDRSLFMYLLKKNQAKDTGFHAILREPNALQVGDKVEIRFRRTAQLAKEDPATFDKIWIGRVVRPYAKAASGHICIDIKGPNKKEQRLPTSHHSRRGGEREVIEIPYNPFSTKAFAHLRTDEQIKDTEAMEAYMKNSNNGFKVDIKTVPDATVRMRLTHGLESLKTGIKRKAASRAVYALMESLDGDEVTSADLYDGISSEYILIAEEGLDTYQQSFMQKQRSATEGVSGLQGPAGPGKTFTLAAVVSPYAGKMLATGACTSQALANNPGLSDANEKERLGFLRVFPRQSERKNHMFGTVEGEKGMGINTAKMSESFVEAIPDLREFHKVAQLMSSGMRSFHGHWTDGSSKSYDSRPIADNRVTPAIYPYSLGFAMYVIAGGELSDAMKEDEAVIRLLRSSAYEGQDRSRWNRFNGLSVKSRQLLAEGQVLDEAESNQLMDLTCELRNFVLRHADAVCTTAVHAMSETMFNAITPRVCNVDEAGRLPEAYVMAILGCYPSVEHLILGGDIAQLGPLVHRYQEKQPHIALYRLSLLERMIKLDWTFETLRRTFVSTAL
ncbi:hypothetical protein KVT40_007620 [Elsinoe batatas]|uniref:DNA2/NAM7 helicase helicase domain-containing protein n=1 Tax=Elsinoe batatas TaxID=2601811 RepID=A0A8K0PET3_9PEZI|nr:hypothetical protein KVT40_007620 [Elsinoe batatas]